MVEAVIFDLDGVLIDSEPLWQEAETQVFTKLGVPMSKELAAETMGLRTDETVQYWRQRYHWDHPSGAQVCQQIDQFVLELIQRDGAPKPGVHEIFAICEQLGLPIAIASSSSTAIIEAAVTKLNLKRELKVIHSAESEPFGKPHPAVYINTARKLGVSPRACLAIEDSLSGVLSAKAAGMYCIAVPAPEERHDKQFAIADVVVDSLLDVTPAMIQAA